MESKNILVVITIFLILIASIGMREGQKAKHSRKIEHEMKTLKCPKNPIYGDLKLELTSPLYIGSETEDQYFFTSLKEIRVDKKGRIYALDNKAARIQVYDTNGKYLKSIGEKGEGPGEFSIPYNFFLDEKGKIYVLDTVKRKITDFSNDWKYKKSISLNAIVRGNFFVDKEENIFFNTLASEPSGIMKINFIKLDPKKDMKKKIMSDFFLKLIIDRKGRFFYDHPYQQNYYFSPLAGGNIVFIKSLESTIYYLSNGGEILHEILKEEKSERITKKEKEIVFAERFKWLKKERRDEVFFPEYRPFYSNLLIDNKNRIYLERFNPINETNSGYSYYVFNGEEKYLYNLDINFRMNCISYGYVYTIETNEESWEIKLLRYKVKNWDQIKMGVQN